ncbi:MAG: hypothetical protein IKX47_08700 [Oscillospiraceae bacterium]|nr:hypothetical protein [Oscillospiraceae bacterium]
MHRMIVLGPVMVLVFALLLPGCSGRQASGQGPAPCGLELNPDGTLGKLRWGMTWEEAGTADSRIVFPEDASPRGRHNILDERADAVIPEVEFLGYKGDLELYFSYFDEEGADSPPRLTAIVHRIYLFDGDADPTSFVDRALGQRNVSEVFYEQNWARDGSFTFAERQELPEEERYWTSGETLGSRFTWETLARVYPTASESRLARMYYGTPLYEIRVSSLGRGPSPQYSASGERIFTYSAVGGSLVLAELLNGSL